MVPISANDIQNAARLMQAAYKSSDDLASLGLVGGQWQPIGSDPLEAGPYQGHQLLKPANLPLLPTWDAYFGELFDSTNFVFDSGNVQAFVSRNVNDGSLSIAFRGSTLQDIVQDIYHGKTSFRTEYRQFDPLIASLDKYILDEGITKVLVTGHSLGGVMAELFLHDHSPGSGVNYVGVTFGSPGESLIASPGDTRLINFGHFADPVFNSAKGWKPGSHDVSVDLTGITGFSRSKSGLLALGILAVGTLGQRTSAHASLLYGETANIIAQSSLFGSFILQPLNYNLVIGTESDRENLFGKLEVNATIAISDFIIGRGGDDDIFGFSGDDLVDGGSGDDHLTGDAGADVLDGSDGNDTLDGGAGSDVLIGGSGDDTLSSGEGDDNLRGAAGDDIIDGGNDGANGDLVVYDSPRSFYQITRTGATITVVALRGSEGTDTIRNVERFQFAGGTVLAAADAPDTQIPVFTPVPELEPVTPLPPSSTGSPILSGAEFSLWEGDGGTRTSNVRVYLSKPSSTTVTFNYVLLGRESTGWARYAEDFGFLGGVASISMGATYFDLSIPVTGDTRIEGNEHIEILLNGPIGAKFANGEESYRIRGTILDDEVRSAQPQPPPAPPPGPVYLTLEADDAALAEGEAGTYTDFRFIVRRSGDLSVQTRYKYEVVGFGAAAASAEDFEEDGLPSSTRSFAAGENKDEFIIRIKGDAVPEAHEAFGVRIIPRSAGVEVPDGEAAVTIRNDDGSTLPSPAGSVYVSIRAFDAVKPEGTSDTEMTAYVFELHREGDLDQETRVRVNLSTTGATPQATAVDDFGQAQPRNVTFDIGETIAYATFYAQADSKNEPDEPLTVYLTPGSGGYSNVVFVDGTAVGLVLNDDGPAPPLVTAPSISVIETDGTQTVYVRVQLSHTTSVPITIGYEISIRPGAATPATPNADFIPMTGSITISPGENSVEIPVTVFGDGIGEGIELIDVRLGRVVNGYFGRSINFWDTTIVVLDDDRGQTWPGSGSSDTIGAIDLGHIAPYQMLPVRSWLDEATPYVIYSIDLAAESVLQAPAIGLPHFLFSSSGSIIYSSEADGIEANAVTGAIAEGAVLQPGQYFLTITKPANESEVEVDFDLSAAPTLDQLPLLMFDALNLSTNDREIPLNSGLEGNVSVMHFYSSFPRTTDVTFDVQFRGLTATSGIDFDDRAVTMTIPAGEVTSNIQFIRTWGDDVYEGNETFEASIQNITGALLPNGQSEWVTTFTIIDDDPSPTPLFVISERGADRAEGSGTGGVFTFTISRPFGGEDTPASVRWNVIMDGLNPASPTDFLSGVFPSSLVEFSAGELSKEVKIFISSDSIPEHDEGFAVYLSHPSIGFAVGKGIARGNIRNDDGVYRPGYLGASDAEAAISYSMGPDELNFLMSGVASSDATGNAKGNHISGNNAANRLLGLGGADILSGEGGDDTIDGGSGADRMYGGTGDDVFIVDDTADEVAEDEASGIDRVTASVSFELPTWVEQLNLTGTTGLKGTGNALDNLITGGTGNDYLRGLKGNDTLRGGPGIDVAVYSGTLADYIVAQNAARTTIADNRLGAPDGTDQLAGIEFVEFAGTAFALTVNGIGPVFSISATDAAKAEGTGALSQASFMVTRTGDVSLAYSLGWSVSGATGTATQSANAGDFIGGMMPFGTVKFAAGEASKAITIAILGDAIGELNESYAVNLSPPLLGATLGTTSATGTIINDDPALSIVSVNATKKEGHAGTTSFTFSVTRSGDTLAAQSVSWAVTGGGIGMATPADFVGGVLPFGKVNFAAGQTSKTIKVDVAGDTIVEPDETFTVSLSQPPAGVSIIPGTAVGTILTDDTGFAIAPTAAPQVEGLSAIRSFTFTVTRSGATTGAASVDWAVTGTGKRPANAADFAGGVLPSGKVSFAPGQTSKTIVVKVAGDTNTESNETFAVTLSNASAGASITTPTAIGTIVNDDTSLSIVATGPSKAEGHTGAASIPFTIKRSGSVTGLTSVKWAVTGSGARPVDAADFAGSVLPSGMVSFSAGETHKTVLVNVAGDLSIEASEAFTITLSKATGGSTTIGAGSVSRTILNDDTAGKTYVLTPAPVSIAGGVGHDLFIAKGSTLISRDRIDGGGGYNQLQLTGGGSFDLGAPIQLDNIQMVLAYEGQAAGGGFSDETQAIYLRDGMDVTVNVTARTPVQGNPSPQSITIYGAEDTATINLGAGKGTVVLGSATETVNGGAGIALVQATVKTAGALVRGGKGKLTLEITDGGTATLHPDTTKPKFPLHKSINH